MTIGSSGYRARSALTSEDAATTSPTETACSQMPGRSSRLRPNPNRSSNRSQYARFPKPFHTSTPATTGAAR